MPRLMPKYEVSTPEQVTRALEETKRDATAIRDLVRQLELPATAFETVAQIFLANINGVMACDAEKTSRERNRKMREIEKLRAPEIERNARGQIVGVRRLQPLDQPTIGSGYNMSADADLYEMDDDELDAEVKRLRDAKR